MKSYKEKRYLSYLFLYLIMMLQITQLNAHERINTMSNKSDKEMLSELNEQFIKNFISMDTTAHNEIIHKDFVCIENSGEIVNRDEYMEEWAVSYGKGNFTSFDYTDEHIRLFGDVALVRSTTNYTRINDGETITGSSVYTDTYIKENGRWWCVQAQITPAKK